ncbi:hypothetical protein [Ferruginibacter sp.]|uniref:hypothetical protein n=1 Tax=Ferruginibacter sp. TaxID=1940288 RepID=UPI0026599152|nr:hypothetical protein [Ferruginibacter sp.]
MKNFHLYSKSNVIALGSNGGQLAKVSYAGQLVMLGQFTILMPYSFDVQRLVTNIHLGGAFQEINN